MSQSAAPFPDTGFRKLKQDICHLPGIHHVGHKDEKRDRNDHIAIVRVVHYLMADYPYISVTGNKI